MNWVRRMSYTEFVSTEALSHDNPKTWRFFDYVESERPIAFQFFDHDAERLVTQCQRAVERLPPQYYRHQHGLFR